MRVDRRLIYVQVSMQTVKRARRQSLQSFPGVTVINLLGVSASYLQPVKHGNRVEGRRGGRKSG